MNYRLSTLFFILLTFSFATSQLLARQSIHLVKDTQRLMEIPGITAIAGSHTHLYVLSSTDGLVVFRAHPDSLQWLYSSEGIRHRGNRLQTDIRFAYLTGNDNRLTVLEPTSVLGVYSSTTLSSRPGPLHRVEDFLYLGMDTRGLFRLPLNTPAAVDTEPVRVHAELVTGKVLDIAGSGRTFLVLDDNKNLFQFRTEGGNIEHQRTFTFSENVQRVFLIDGAIILSDASGSIYEMNAGGDLVNIITINGSPENIVKRDQHFVIRNSEGQIFAARPAGSVTVLRNDRRAGNLMAVSRNQLWVTEYNLISTASLQTRPAATATANESVGGTSGRFRINPISNQIIPFSRTLLLPIELSGSVPANELQFQIRSSANTQATIRGQGFFWQPGPRDIGENRFTIIATSMTGVVDSTSFMVDVRSFNAPPRFTPVRPLSIPAGDRFELPVRATDPDGTNPDLIRYLGVNLPEGATLDERTGLFRWTPHRRQIGQHEFQVIATDQFGSAASQTITLNVLELTR
jgi:hypothetical protein